MFRKVTAILSGDACDESLQIFILLSAKVKPVETS
jgi:hypothetical protein